MMPWVEVCYKLYSQSLVEYTPWLNWWSYELRVLSLKLSLTYLRSVQRNIAVQLASSDEHVATKVLDTMHLHV